MEKNIMIKLLRKPNVIVKLANLQSKVKFPEKFKGTILEKWANYWKNLVIDYRQMLQDLRSDMQDDPIKAIKWTTSIVTVFALIKNVPSELDFRDHMKCVTNEVILVNEECRNPESVRHLQYLQQCYNENVIHCMSLGMISFMYTSDLNDCCDLYKAHCSYLKPSYLTLFSRIVDVGFMGRWWNIHIKTTNYDVNI